MNFRASVSKGNGHKEYSATAQHWTQSWHQSGPILAKVLYFATSISQVGWNRFQNIYYLNNGITALQIGQLKSLGLLLKLFGEPFWCLVADFTDPKLIYALVLFTNIFSMELIRLLPLTYNLIIIVKFVRTATAPMNTLTTIASLKLIEGSKEGYGEQRLYGSLAWGIGAFIVGVLIDQFGMNSMFAFTYLFQAIALGIVLKYLPGKTTLNQLTSVASISSFANLTSGSGSGSTNAIEKW
jgi:PPP family 3-phenylpropionic acid transporter